MIIKLFKSQLNLFDNQIDAFDDLPVGATKKFGENDTRRKEQTASGKIRWVDADKTQVDARNVRKQPENKENNTHKLSKKDVAYFEKMLPTVLRDLENGRDFSSTILSIKSGLLRSEFQAVKKWFIDKGVIDNKGEFIKRAQDKDFSSEYKKISMPKDMNEGLSNFYQMIINDLAEGDFRNAQFTIQDLISDLRSKAQPYPFVTEDMIKQTEAIEPYIEKGDAETAINFLKTLRDSSDNPKNNHTGSLIPKGYILETSTQKFQFTGDIDSYGGYSFVELTPKGRNKVINKREAEVTFPKQQVEEYLNKKQSEQPRVETEKKPNESSVSGIEENINHSKLDKHLEQKFNELNPEEFNTYLEEIANKIHIKPRYKNDAQSVKRANILRDWQRENSNRTNEFTNTLGEKESSDKQPYEMRKDGEKLFDNKIMTFDEFRNTVKVEVIPSDNIKKNLNAWDKKMIEIGAKKGGDDKKTFTIRIRLDDKVLDEFPNEKKYNDKYIDEILKDIYKTEIVDTYINGFYSNTIPLPERVAKGEVSIKRAKKVLSSFADSKLRLHWLETILKTKSEKNIPLPIEVLNDYKGEDWADEAIARLSTKKSFFVRWKDRAVNTFRKSQLDLFGTPVTVKQPKVSTAKTSTSNTPGYQYDMFTGQEKDGKKLLPSEKNPNVRRWQSTEEEQSESRGERKEEDKKPSKKDVVDSIMDRAKEVGELQKKVKDISMMYDGQTKLEIAEDLGVDLEKVNLPYAEYHKLKNRYNKYKDGEISKDEVLDQAQAKTEADTPENLVSKLTGVLEDHVKDFGIKEVFMQDGELHITSDYDIPEYVERQIEKKLGVGEEAQPAEAPKSEEVKSSFDRTNEAIRNENRELREQYKNLPIGTRITATQDAYKQSYRLMEVMGDKFFIGEQDGQILADGGSVLSPQTIMRSYKDDMILPGQPKTEVDQLKERHESSGNSLYDEQLKKVEEARKFQEMMKAVNKIVRMNITDDEKVTRIMSDHGISEGTARKLLQPDFAGRVGFADYQLTNHRSKLKRLEQRLNELTPTKQDEEVAESGLKDIGSISKSESQGIFEGVGVKAENHFEDERVRLFFDSIPSSEARTFLKRSGFIWSPRNQAWQRKNTQNGINAVHRVMRTILGK